MARNNTHTKGDKHPAEERDTTLFINNYPASLIHKHSTPKSTFTTVSFMYKDKWASFILGENMIKESTRKDGSLIENCFNLLLGKSHQRRKVSFKADDGNYTAELMSNSDIRTFINNSRENKQAA